MILDYARLGGVRDRNEMKHVNAGCIFLLRQIRRVLEGSQQGKNMVGFEKLWNLCLFPTSCLSDGKGWVIVPGLGGKNNQLSQIIMENKPNNKSHKNMSCPTNLKWHGKLDENLVEEESPFCYCLAGTQTSSRVDGELPKSWLHHFICAK